MKDKSKMEEFFEEMRKILQDDKLMIMDSRQVYNYLKYYKVMPNSDKEYEIDDACNKIVEYSKKRNFPYMVKIKGKSPSKWTHMYVNKENVDYSSTIKLYIPIKYDKVTTTLSKIYYYLIENKIECETKISSSSKSDNFVVRMYNIDDVRPFLDYCSHAKIQDNLLETNPFISTINNIGVVRDEALIESFNGGLSKALSEFLTMCQMNNCLDKLNSINFREYILEVINREPNPDLKYNYLCVFDSINEIIEGLDPLEDIRKNIESKPYGM